ncbi:MAG: chromate transporter, partial [Candidatus Limnocylindria bacterium]
LGLRVPAPVARAEVPSPVGRWTGAALLALFLALLAGLPILAALAGEGAAMLEAFYRAGALVFGGGHVVLPLLHESVVPAGWVGEDAFLAGYGAAQAVPGPLFTFAAYLGAVMTAGPGGPAGGALALGAIFLPSFLLIWGALPYWNDLRRNMAFRHALLGTNAAVVGILLAALYQPIWVSAVTSVTAAAVAAVAFGLIATGRVPPWVAVAGCAVAGEVLLAV